MKPVYKKVSKLTGKGYEVYDYCGVSRVWYLNGKLHREDGPAIEWSGGNSWWYLNGKEVFCDVKYEDLKMKETQKLMKIYRILEI
jgi:hypothetical protein